MQTMFVSKKWRNEMRNKVKQRQHGEILEAWCEQQYVSEEVRSKQCYQLWILSGQRRSVLTWRNPVVPYRGEESEHMRSQALVADTVSHINSYEWSIGADILPDDDEQGLNNCQNSPEAYLSFWIVQKICDNITNTWRTWTAHGSKHSRLWDSRCSLTWYSEPTLTPNRRVGES